MTAKQNGSTAQLKIMICAVEPSGDALGAELMEALRAMSPDVDFIGCGGPLMAANGLRNLFSIAPFSVVGPIDALKALPAAMRGASALARAAKATPVDAAIFIDGWAFVRMAAARIKQQAPQTTMIKYVAPQVWASRPQRAGTLAKLFDGVLTLFAFEKKWFENEDVLTKFVGNPVFQSAAQDNADAARFRDEYAIGNAPLLAVLPGSRKSEVRRLIERFRETVDLLAADIEDMRVAIPVAPAVAQDVRRLTEGWSLRPLLVPAKDRYQVFAAADAGLAASGTVTTELAIFRTPLIVAYRVGWLSALWFRQVIITPYVTLLNIVADRAVIPEFLQDDCQPANMAEALAPLLADTPARKAQLEAFPELLGSLGVGGPPAAQEAGKAILDWISQKKTS